MLLKSLKMNNFRQFKGVTKIAFSCNKEENVTIILGDNTYGKTTLLQAFSWCLYETVTFDKSPDFLLNLELSNTMRENDSEKVEVEIELIHGDINYVVSRCQEYIKKNGSVKAMNPIPKVSYKQNDGQTEAVKPINIINVISNILPQDLSSYFFFDTERVRSISMRSDVTQAVKGLLGLSILENAVKHLGSRTTKTTVIGKFYHSMDSEGDTRANEALIRIQDAQDKRLAIAEQLDTCNSQIQYYEKRKEQLDAILRDNQTTAALQKRKENIDRQIKEELDAQAKLIEAYLVDFNQGSKNFYAQPLLRRALDFLSEAKVDDKGIKDLTAVTILDIIERGKCICGTEIIQDNEAYEQLKMELAYVPPESIGNAVRNYIEKIDTFGSASNQIFTSIKNRFEELYRSKTRVQDWNDELEDISTKIKGKENMKKHEQELNDVKNRLKEFNAKRNKLYSNDGICKNDIEKYQKIYDSLIAVSDKNRSVMTYITYAEEIKDWLESSYKEKETEIRERLEERVNKIFEMMYHGSRRVVINSKYQVTLLSTINDIEVDTGESEGANRVKNFAFIAGLVALAKERIMNKIEESGINLSSEPYPLVMDAPFSNADEKHTSNISKVLPEIAEQVIMFVMQKDWHYAEPVMSSRVGKRYSLHKHSETYTELKEA